MDLDYFSRDNTSIRYCNEHFGHYAVFALRPLQIAYYKHSNLKFLFDTFGQSFTTVQQAEKFMKGLIYDDSEFFGPEEVMFFCKFRNYRGCLVLSDERIESDRQSLRTEIEHVTHIIPLHAKYLLKAINFWVLRSNEKLLEWDTDLDNALHQWEIRTNPFEYYSEDDEKYKSDEEDEWSEDNNDDGYYSDQ